MAVETTTRCLHDVARHLRAQTHVPGAVREDDVLLQRSLAVGNRLVDDLGHLLQALHARSLARVDTAETAARHQISEDHLLDTRLAERRKNALDVTQEHAVRPDDEHALVLQRETVRVQQVGGAVQCNHRLAGAGSALHDEHARLR